METCLQTLWELLREPMAQILDDSNILNENGLSEKQTAATKCIKLINLFYDKLEDRIGQRRLENCKPNHIELFENALKNFESKPMAGIKEGIEKAKEESRKCNLCAICRKCSIKFYEEVLGQQIAEKKLPYELKDYFTELPQMYYYQVSMRKDRTREHLKNILLMLKGFSSSTPTIHSAVFDSECRGGGLYINYDGIGIVIDPGIGFVNSMHKHGIYITDIHVVVITHDHYDHNADAEAISSLLYDYNNYNKKRYKIIKDVFEVDDIKEHEIEWIVDSSTAKKLKGKIDSPKKLKKFVCVDNKKLIAKDKRIRLRTIETGHIKDGESFGLIFELLYDNKWFKIGYTSDTPYFSSLPIFFKNVNMLIFHVSDLYRKDVKGVKDKTNHLGYNGSIKLLRDVDVDFVIASEFCCTNGDFRMDFMKSIVGEMNNLKNVSFLPGEIGLKVSLPEKKVECSLCKRKVRIEEIKVLAPNQPFGKIQFSCRQCAQDVIY